MSTDSVSGDVSEGVPARDAPARPWALALTAIVGAEFMLQLDGTIVNVALPTLQSDLGLSITGGSWVPNGFLLAFGGLLLLAGRLGDVLGHRRVFLAGIGLVVGGLAAGGSRAQPGGPAARPGPAGRRCGDRRADRPGAAGDRLRRGAPAARLRPVLHRHRAGGLRRHGPGRRADLGGGLALEPAGQRAHRPAPHRRRRQGAGSARRGHPVASARPAERPAGHRGRHRRRLRAGARRREGLGDAWTLVPLGAAVVLAAALLVSDRRAEEPLLPLAVFAGRQRAEPSWACCCSRRFSPVS